MSDLCSLIWCALIGIFRPRAALQAENLVLRHQLNVLRRKSPKRLAFGNVDRLVFTALYRVAPGVLDALKILNPRARAKLNFDPELRAFVLSKALMLGLSYPYDWGFIPSTRAEDGDPLDAMVIHDAATYPGLIMRCKLIGVLQTLQQTKRKRIRNDRVIAVPENSHRERELHGLEGISPEVRAELEKFFVATDELEAKTLRHLAMP
jgi:inorganic pyrophosphatase